MDALAAQDHVALAQENLDLARQGRQVVAKRIAAGKVAPTEQPKANVEEALAKVALRQSQRDLAGAREKLALMWGSTEATFTKVQGSLTAVRPVPALKALTPLVAQSPAVARGADEIARYEAAEALARARGVPDVTVGVGYRNIGESEDHAMVVAVGVPLPVFDRNQGGIRRARAELMKARLDRLAEQTRVRAALQEAHRTLTAAHANVASLRDEVLPAARSAFEASTTSFQQGKSGFLDVLAARRTLTQARGQYLEALASYHQAVAELEGLIGQPLTAVGQEATAAKEKNND